MGHPEPCWRKQTSSCYVQLGGKQIRLANDQAEAHRLYHELMARKPVGPPSAMTTLGLLGAFLEWSEKNRERPTYEAYRCCLQSLADSVPASLPTSDLKVYHLTRGMDAKGRDPTTRNDFASAVIRAFNWGVKQGLIDRNPVAGMEEPALEVRELALGPVEYAEVMTQVAEPHLSRRSGKSMAGSVRGMPQRTSATMTTLGPARNQPVTEKPTRARLLFSV